MDQAPYFIKNWGQGLFSVNEKGHLQVLPKNGDSSHGIDLMDVINEVKTMGPKLPVVLRFHDILRLQVKKINQTFRQVIDDADYQGQYYGVYPIKVNQMREVVEEIVDAGRVYDFGLEAGSKTELLSALAYNTNPRSLTILNGHKDRDFLKLSLLGHKLGRNIVVVIEKFSELIELVELIEETGICPTIGLRGKLLAQSSGKWCDSSGEKAKFGLTSSELINAVHFLKEKELIGALRLFHFHIGSQIPNIRTFKDALAEAGRIYGQLSKMGAPLEYFDVGGGLGVDYDGTRTNSDSSTNYGAEEYAADVVWGLKQICDLEGVPHPHIVSESGRWLTAHHSCVITNVIGTVHSSVGEVSTRKKTGENILVENMRELLPYVSKENIQEVYHDAEQLKASALSAFKLGVLGLEERAKIETLYWQVLRKISSFIETTQELPEGLGEVENLLAEQYLCNFSIFQSAADSWAIDQVLPVVPLSRLNEVPNARASIVDITCDSDGKITKFIGGEGHQKSIPVCRPQENEDYYIGLFLTGAYQDVMGDMHNLFGRPDEVHVFYDPTDSKNFYIEEVIKGQKARNVLRTMQYNPELMAYSVKKELDKLVMQKHMNPREGVRWTDFYEDCLAGHTYLTKG